MFNNDYKTLLPYGIVIPCFYLLSSAFTPDYFSFSLQIFLAAILSIIFIQGYVSLRDRRTEILEEVQLDVQALGRINRLIFKAEISLLVFLLISLIIMEAWTIFVQVFWGAGYTWMKQLFRYSVIWIGFLGASIATYEDSHISISILPKSAFWTHRLTQTCIYLYAMVICVVLAIGSWGYIHTERLAAESGTMRSNTIEIRDAKIYLPTNELLQLQKQLDSLELQKRAHLEFLLYSGQLKDIETLEEELGRFQQKLEKITGKQEEKSELVRTQIEDRWESIQEALDKAWAEEGENAWEKAKDKGLSFSEEQKWFQLEIKEKWLASRWQEEWLEEWKSHYQKLEEEDPEIDEEEEQNAWINSQWQQKWKKEWLSYWQQDGLQAFFRTRWTKEWLAGYWQQNQNVAPFQKTAEISGTFTKPEDMENYKEETWKIPRWSLLFIIPVAFWIMAFRFFLHFLNAIVHPSTNDNLPEAG